MAVVVDVGHGAERAAIHRIDQRIERHADRPILGVGKPPGGLAVSLTTIAWSVTAATRPARRSGFVQKSRALTLRLSRSPTTGTATALRRRDHVPARLHPRPRALESLWNLSRSRSRERTRTNRHAEVRARLRNVGELKIVATGMGSGTTPCARTSTCVVALGTPES